jgi:hypothetical protein
MFDIDIDAIDMKITKLLRYVQKIAHEVFDLQPNKRLFNGI